MSQKLVRLLGGVMAVFCLVSNRVHAATMTTTTPTTPGTSTPTTPETTTPTTPETTTPTTPETSTPTTPETTTPTTPGTSTPTTPTTPGTSTPTTPSGGTSFTCPAKTAPWPLPGQELITAVTTQGATLIGSGQTGGVIYNIYKRSLSGPQITVGSGYAVAGMCDNPAKYGTGAYCDASGIIYMKGWGNGIPSGISSFYTGQANPYNVLYVFAGCADGYYNNTSYAGGETDNISRLSSLCAPCYGIDYQTGHAECGFYAAAVPGWGRITTTTPSVTNSIYTTPTGNGFYWYSVQGQTGMASCRAMPIDDVSIMDGSDDSGTFEIIVEDECVYSD